MTYSQFRDRWNISSGELSPLDYANIKLAIRRFDCPDTDSKNIKLIDTEISLSFLFQTRSNNLRKIRSKEIRDKMVSRASPDIIPPIVQWSRELNRNVDWIDVFTNLFYTLTNNFKLIQFHYKLWHRISTCRYMRHKMKIDLESPLCSLCEEEIETLDHIFLHCKHTTEFIERVNQFINSKIDRAYRDTNLYYRITLAHTDNRINFFNAVANWFISKKFQSKSPLIFPAFINEVKLSLLGEKVSISSSFRNIFSS